MLLMQHIHLLARNIRIEKELVDQLFNSSEKRLARALLLLARDGTEGTERRARGPLSAKVLPNAFGHTLRRRIPELPERHGRTHGSQRKNRPTSGRGRPGKDPDSRHC
jgi:hypothetical protein